MEYPEKDSVIAVKTPQQQTIIVGEPQQHLSPLSGPLNPQGQQGRTVTTTKPPQSVTTTKPPQSAFHTPGSSYDDERVRMPSVQQTVHRPSTSEERNPFIKHHPNVHQLPQGSYQPSPIKYMTASGIVWSDRGSMTSQYSKVSRRGHDKSDYRRGGHDFTFGTFSLCLAFCVFFIVAMTIEQLELVNARRMSVYHILLWRTESVFVKHEYYRFISALLMHSSPLHLAIDVFILFVGRTYVEQRIGFRRFVLLGVSGFLVGTLNSALFDHCQYYSMASTFCLALAGYQMGESAVALTLLGRRDYQRGVAGQILITLVEVSVLSVMPNISVIAHITACTWGFAAALGTNLGALRKGWFVSVMLLSLILEVMVCVLSPVLLMYFVTHSQCAIHRGKENS